MAVHRGEIKINQYVDTSIGPMLDYKIDSHKKIAGELKKLDLVMSKSKSKSKSNAKTVLSHKPSTACQICPNF